MENKRIGDIDRLLQKLKEENSLYRNSKKQEPYESKQLEEDEEEEDHLPSRYKAEYSSESESHEGQEGQEDIEEESEESSEEDAREKIKKRLEEIRQRKNQMGPPARVEKARDENARPQTAKSQISRPQSARILKTPSYYGTPVQNKNKKTDRVAMYQQRQKE